MRSRWLIFIGLLFLAASQAQAQDRWAEANAKYAAGDFRAAVSGYTQLVEAGETSAALFYNLGNAHYRLNELGAAILNYERALALEPQQPEAVANLRLVREKARALELRGNRLEQALARTSPTMLASVAALGFWLAVFALAGWFLFRRSALAVVGCLLGLALFAGAGYGLYALEQGPNGRGLAIIVGKQVDARLATAESAGTVLTLPPGSEVKILSTRGGWSYAVLAKRPPRLDPGGERGTRASLDFAEKSQSRRAARAWLRRQSAGRARAEE